MSGKGRGGMHAMKSAAASKSAPGGPASKSHGKGAPAKKDPQGAAKPFAPRPGVIPGNAKPK